MIRTKVSGRTTVHAGPVEELAELALEYADGERGSFKTLGAESHHFANAARHLVSGGVAESAGYVEFWADRSGGAPFHGPSDLRPDPDPVWLAANPEYRAEPAEAHI